MNAIEAAKHCCDQIRTPGGISSTILDGIKEAEAQRDSAIKHIAEWCVAIEVNGSGWDDWDEYYKDAMYSDRKSLPEIRGLLVEAIEAARKQRANW
jgi:hypothetical protein